MSNLRIITLAILATTLTAGVVVATSVNPLIAIGLAPVLLAIAAIVRAVGDSADTTPKDEDDTDTTEATEAARNEHDEQQEIDSTTTDQAAGSP